MVFAAAASPVRGGIFVENRRHTLKPRRGGIFPLPPIQPLSIDPDAEDAAPDGFYKDAAPDGAWKRCRVVSCWFNQEVHDTLSPSRRCDGLHTHLQSHPSKQVFSVLISFPKSSGASLGMRVTTDVPAKRHTCLLHLSGNSTLNASCFHDINSSFLNFRVMPPAGTTPPASSSFRLRHSFDNRHLPSSSFFGEIWRFLRTRFPVLL